MIFVLKDTVCADDGEGGAAADVCILLVGTKIPKDLWEINCMSYSILFILDMQGHVKHFPRITDKMCFSFQTAEHYSLWIWLV